MEMKFVCNNMGFGFTLLGFIIFRVAICTELSPELGPNVCGGKREKFVFTENFKDFCGVFGWKLYPCIGQRYSIKYRITGELKCCDGWAQSSPDDLNCTLPVCFGRVGKDAGTCDNHGVCIAPNTCQCPGGFSDESCADIDECQSPESYCVGHLCLNTIGSYACYCNKGYVPQASSTKCTAVCFGRTGDLAGTCANGGFCAEPDQCVCANGYQGKNCAETVDMGTSEEEDIADDAEQCSYGNGGCEQICKDTPEGYECSCSDGYQLAENGKWCTAICFGRSGDLAGTCQNNGKCLDPDSCDCLDGFGGTDCRDIDECGDDGGGCTRGCINTIGSYKCTCPDGSTIDPEEDPCKSKDKCLEKNGGCDQICNSESQKCECEAGYVLMVDERSCSDIDECLENNGKCMEICLNSLGTYVCDCGPGKVLSRDGRTCQDMCAENPCKHRGKCSSDAEQGFTCDCTGTNFDGLTCEQGNIRIPEQIEVQNGGAYFSTKIKYRVDRVTRIWASADPTVSVMPNPIILRPTGDQVNISVNAKTVGKFMVNFNTSKDSMSSMEVLSADVFIRFGLKRGLLPKPCFLLNFFDHQFSSTMKWYRHKTRDKTYFTNGIAYYVARGKHLPMNVDGMILSYADTIKSDATLFIDPEEGTLVGEKVEEGCEEVKLSAKDLHELKLARSPLKTLIHNLKGLVAYWFLIDPVINKDDPLPAQYSGNITTGSNILDTVCDGSPVSLDSIYVVFRFTDSFYLDIVGQNMLFPKARRELPYCLVTEFIYSTTYSILFNEENNEMVSNVEFAKYFTEQTDIILYLKGIGMSDNWQFTEIFGPKAAVFYNGANMFEYPLPKKIQMFASLRGKREFSESRTGKWDLYLDAEVSCFVDIEPEKFFTHFYIDPNHAYVIMHNLDLKIKLQIFGELFTLDMSSSFAHQGCIAAIGGAGDDRKACGPRADPPGIFAKLFVHAHMFPSTPLMSTILLSSTDGFYYFRTFDDKEDQASLWKDENLKNMQIVFLNRLQKLQVYIQKVTKSKGHLMKKATMDSLGDFNDAVESMRQEISELHYVNATAHYFADFTRNISILFKQVENKLFALDDAQYLKYDLVAKKIIPVLQKYVALVQGHVRGAVWELYEGSIPYYPADPTWGIHGVMSFTVIGVTITLEGDWIIGGKRFLRCPEVQKYCEHISDTRNSTRIKGILKLFHPPKGSELESFWSFLKPKVGIGIEVTLSKLRPAFCMKTEMDFTALFFKLSMPVYITDKLIGFKTRIKLLNFISVEISMEVKIPRNFKDLVLRLSGRFSTDDGNDSIKDTLWAYVKDNAQMDMELAVKRRNTAEEKKELSKRQLEKAKADHTVARNDVEEKKSAYSTAMAKLNHALEALDKAKQPIKKEQKKIDLKMKSVNKLCTICSGVSCLFKNAACTSLKIAAYAGFAAAKVALYIPMQALFLAEEVVAGAKTAVEIHKKSLEMVEEFEFKAIRTKEFWHFVLSTTDELIKSVRMFVLNAVNRARELIVSTSLYYIKFRDCTFSTEVSTEKIFAFQVFCQINLVDTGWKTLSFEFNMKDVFASLWQAARKIYSSLTSAFKSKDRKKRNSSVWFKPWDTEKSYNYTPVIHVTPLTWSKRCKQVAPIITYLNISASAWKNITSELSERIKMKQNELSKMAEEANANNNISLVDLNVDLGIAKKEFNLSEGDMIEILKRQNFSENIHVKSIRDLVNSQLENDTYILHKWQNISLLGDWLSRMESEPFPGNCVMFSDCVLWSFHQIQMLLQSIDPELRETFQGRVNDARNAFSLLLFNDSVTFESLQALDLDLTVLYEVDSLICSRAPVITRNPSNVTAIAGQPVDLYCFAESNVPPTYYWYKEERLIAFGTNMMSLHLGSASTETEGIYLCVCGNHVDNTTSTTAKITIVTPPSIEEGLPAVLDMYVAEEKLLAPRIGGEPQPTLVWHFAGLEQHRITTSNHASNTSLIVSFDASGQCLQKYKVTNDYGYEESTETILKVYDAIASCPSLNLMTGYIVTPDTLPADEYGVEGHLSQGGGLIINTIQKSLEDLLQQNQSQGFAKIHVRPSSTKSHSLQLRLTSNCNYSTEASKTRADVRAYNYWKQLNAATGRIRQLIRQNSRLFHRGSSWYALNSSHFTIESVMNECPHGSHFKAPHFCVEDLPLLFLPPPTNLMLQLDDDSVTVSWQPPNYAEHFVKEYSVRIKNAVSGEDLVYNTSVPITHFTMNLELCEEKCTVFVSALTQSHQSLWDHVNFNSESGPRLSSNSPTGNILGIVFGVSFLLLIPVNVCVFLKCFKKKTKKTSVVDVRHKLAATQKMKKTETQLDVKVIGRMAMSDQKPDTIGHEAWSIDYSVYISDYSSSETVPHPSAILPHDVFDYCAKPPMYSKLSSGIEIQDIESENPLQGANTVVLPRTYTPLKENLELKPLDLTTEGITPSQRSRSKSLSARPTSRTQRSEFRHTSSPCPSTSGSGSCVPRSGSCHSRLDTILGHQER